MASTSAFGEHLRREREMRGVSLAEVSSATRISTKFLEAIENGQWDRLPGGAFNRGYIRSTSRYLGLDEDGMVAEYALETNGPNGHSVHVAPRVSPEAPRVSRRTAIRAAATIGAVILLIALAWFVASKLTARFQQRKPAANTTITLTPNATLLGSQS